MRLEERRPQLNLRLELTSKKSGAAPEGCRRPRQTEMTFVALVRSPRI